MVCLLLLTKITLIWQIFFPIIVVWIVVYIWHKCFAIWFVLVAVSPSSDQLYLYSLSLMEKNDDDDNVDTVTLNTGGYNQQHDSMCLLSIGIKYIFFYAFKKWFVGSLGHLMNISIKFYCWTSKTDSCKKPIAHHDLSFWPIIRLFIYSFQWFQACNWIWITSLNYYYY